MDFAFTPEQVVMRKTIIEFARQELNPGLAERDRMGIFPRDLWNKCAQMRLIAMPFPEKYGGDGFDFITTIAVYHALGYACKDSGLVHALTTQIICGLQILLFGSDEQSQPAACDCIWRIHLCPGNHRTRLWLGCFRHADNSRQAGRWICLKRLQNHDYQRTSC